MTSRIYNSRDALTFLLLTSLTVLVPPAGAFAQSLPTLEAESGAAYARIRHLEGEVTVTGSQGERTGDSLGVNSPVLPSDQVATGAGRVQSRGRVQGAKP